MDHDTQIHKLFGLLESAVRMVAEIDCVSDGIDEWFRGGHHLSYQERWERFRDTRRKSNESWIEHYGQLLHQSQSMLDPITDCYWRAKPELESITFGDKPDDVIVQTAELLRATVKWHHNDFGYWKYLTNASNYNEAQRNKEQIEASDANYPLREKEGREWIGHLRKARGLMLRAADSKQATSIERLKELADESERSGSLGVSLHDAMLFVDGGGDADAASEEVNRFSRSNHVKPKRIGKCPHERRRYLHPVGEVVRCVKAFYGLDSDETKGLKLFLETRKRAPFKK